LKYGEKIFGLCGGLRAVRDGRQKPLIPAGAPPIVFNDNKTKRCCWDLDGFTSGPQYGEPVRVVRCVETTTIMRQHGKEMQRLESEWFWVASVPPARASARSMVCAGHGRWGIENRGFNEL